MTCDSLFCVVSVRDSSRCGEGECSCGIRMKKKRMKKSRESIRVNFFLAYVRREEKMSKPRVGWMWL